MKHSVLVTILVGAFAPICLLAADVDLALHVGDTYTDNSRLTNTDVVSDNVGGVSLRLDATQETTRTELRVRSGVTYLHYFEDTQESATLRGFSGDATLKLVPGRFTWMASEDYGPVLNDPLSSDIPDNWAYDSYFATGPDLTIGSATGKRATLSGRYRLTDYEQERTPDNRQFFGEVAFIFPSSIRSSKSLYVNTLRVEQEDVADTDGITYDKYEAFLRVQSEGVRNSFSVDAGAGNIVLSGTRSTAPLLRAGWEHQWSRLLTTYVTAGWLYQDNFDRVSRLMELETDIQRPQEDVFTLAVPMREKYAAFLFEVNGIRTNVGLSFGYNEVDYEEANDPLANQKYVNVTFDAQRRLSQAWAISVGALYDRRELPALLDVNEDVYVFVSSSWVLGRHLQLRTNYRRLQRRSAVESSGFDNNSVQVEFIYRITAGLGKTTPFSRRNTLYR